ncbi:T9SS type A sorting domain-containing protein [Bacteroidota bacterium]
MKKTLLFCFALAITISTSAQHFTVKNPDQVVKAPIKITKEPIGAKKTIKKTVNPRMQTAKGSKAVNVISIGNAANAYGFYNGGRSATSVNDSINVITFTHRSTTSPGSGYLRYDISKDGGLTWDVNLGPIYNPDAVTHFDARYPNGMIYNPPGNSVAGNAYLAYFAPTLDGSNANWGGYCHGVYKLDTSVAATQNSMASHGAYRQAVNPTFTMTQKGVAFAVDDARIDGIGTAYTDSLIITKGTWNGTSNDFVYTQSLLYFPTSVVASGDSASVADIKISFAPDGMTGYISLISHHDTALISDEGYYPIVFKTTDGGSTWSAPIDINLSAIASIYSDNFLSDAELASYFNPPVPARNEIPYRTSFDHNIAVDANGNPHICITVAIGAGNAFTVPSAGFKGIFDVYSLDGGATWDATLLSRTMNMRGEFGGISEDNRPMATTNMTGTKIFFTWLDTDTNLFPGIGNAQPDIWFRAKDISTPMKSTVAYNVTQYTAIDGEAYMGSISRYVFQSGTTYSIPLVAQEMDVTDPAQPVQYKYIQGFEVSDSDFYINPGIKDMPNTEINVSQNYPNPFNDFTLIDIYLDRSAELSITVYNIMGQKVLSNELGKRSNGKHIIKIDSGNLESGIYFYTVTADNVQVTKKMIVQ